MRQAGPAMGKKVKQAEDSEALWPKIVTAVAVVALAIVVWTLLPLDEWIEAFRSWVAEQGLWGHVAFVLVYMVATLMLAPGAPLTLAAGLAFGFAAFPTVVLGATAGAGLAFLSGRYLARGWVERQTRKSRLFRAVDSAIESEGWKIVGLMRLSPLVPFNLQNYFFGATSVGFWPYLLATFFGIMPGVLLYIWIGTLGAAAGSGLDASEGDAGFYKWTGFVIGLLATAVVTVIISRKAQQKLREAGINDNPA